MPQRTFDRTEKPVGGLTFAETPFSAISRFTWSPESPEARPLFKAPREDGSSFRVDLEQSTPNERPFMKLVSFGRYAKAGAAAERAHLTKGNHDRGGEYR